ncbi:universal stress protein [Amnibacterium sp.]|uniref:universal stress protein n=1 Tax=Amnibacterium sp. TaxID=1872496 RepID=UPI0026246307|nr:universal stress protein [Amnibacterium sp.]MCU1473906.1 uspA1 [Amnibacterium sp.]
MVDTVIGTDDAERAELPEVERVLLAVRGSFAGVAAARWLIARASNRPLAVQVSVAPDAAPDAVAGLLDLPDPADAGTRVQEYLTLVDPGIATTVVRLSEDREADVLDAALDADLLVLATTGNDRGAGPGSFATLLAAQAVCATVVVPRAWAPTAGPVVVGVGNGIGEYAALDRAALEAELQQRELVLLRASQLPRSVVDDIDVEFSATVDRQSLDDAVVYVRERHPALPVRPVLTSQAPADALRELGRDAALIVVGSRPGGGVVDGIDAAVRSVLEEPQCPVMVVPPAPAGAA